MMIYAIRATAGGRRFIKFGRAVNVAHRLSSLQSGSPRQRLKLMACADWPNHEERRIHAYLDDFRARGEWFAEGPETDHVIALLVDPDGLSKWLAQTTEPSSTIPKRLACAYNSAKPVD